MIQSEIQSTGKQQNNHQGTQGSAAAHDENDEVKVSEFEITTIDRVPAKMGCTGYVDIVGI